MAPCEQRSRQVGLGGVHRGLRTAYLRQSVAVLYLSTDDCESSAVVLSSRCKSARLVLGSLADGDYQLRLRLEERIGIAGKRWKGYFAE